MLLGINYYRLCCVTAVILIFRFLLCWCYDYNQPKKTYFRFSVEMHQLKGQEISSTKILQYNNYYCLYPYNINIK